MPYVNKSLNKFITDYRFHLDCPDLKSELRKLEVNRSAETMFAFDQPWGTIFPRFPKFLASCGTPYWYSSLLRLLQPHDLDYNLLLSKFQQAKGEHPSGMPIESLAIIFNSIVETRDRNTLYAVFTAIPAQLSVLLMGKVRDSQSIANFFNGTDSVKVPKFFYEAILIADALDWPEIMIEAMEGKFDRSFKAQVSLPFTADKIQKLLPGQLQSIMQTFRDPLLIIKIFNALLEVDSESINILTIENFKLILDDGLARNPKAMTSKQFAKFVKYASELFGDNVEFQMCLSEFTAKITEVK